MSEQPPNSDQTSPTTPSLPVVEEDLDAANQSLADALRLSFKILKAAMFLIVISFLCSGFFTVDQNQVGLVLRFGALTDGGDGGKARGPGFQVALPDPIDEKILLPTEQQTLVTRRFGPAGTGGALQPGVDGYMITADQNLIHADWTVQYRVDDPVALVTRVVDAENFADSGLSALIRSAVENAVVRTAARYTASEILRPTSDDFRLDVRRRVRERLTRFGIEIVDVGTRGQPAPPEHVIAAFTARTTAGQRSDQQQKKAEGERTATLTNTAGEGYPELLDKIDAYELAQRQGDTTAVQRIEAEIRDLMLNHASGETAQRINEARGRRTELEQTANADLKKFRDLLPEFRRSPETVAASLVNQVRVELFKNAIGVLFLPAHGRRVLEIPSPIEWQKEVETEAYRLESSGQE